MRVHRASFRTQTTFVYTLAVEASSTQRRVDSLRHRPYGPRSWKYLLFGPLQKRFADPCSETTERFLNKGSFGVSLPHPGYHLGVFGSHTGMPTTVLGSTALPTAGQRVQSPEQPAAALSEKSPQNVGLCTFEKTKNPTIIYHQGWQGKESPSENGGGASSNNIGINRTTGNKHAHHIKEYFLLTMIKMKFRPKWNHFSWAYGNDFQKERNFDFYIR